MSLISSFALEQRMKAIRYAQWAQRYGAPTSAVSSQWTEKEKHEAQLDIRGFARNAERSLRYGETYYIRKGPIEMIMAEAMVLDLSKLTCHRHLVESAGFMWLEVSPLRLKDLTFNSRPVPNCEINAISWIWSDHTKINSGMPNEQLISGLTIIGYEDFPHERNVLEPKMSVSFQENSSLNRHGEGADKMQLVASFLIAASAFMKQKIVIKSTERANRHTIKRLSTEWDGSTVIHDVQLRAIEYERRESSGLTQRDYSCRWWVRGHWRMQPYPSTGQVIPIFIDSYVKGPTDKPIKHPGTPVFVVTR